MKEFDGSVIDDPRKIAPSDERTDEQLLEEYCVSADTALFAVLVGRYERELFNYLFRYLGDAGMAEDVFQATILQVHLKRDLYETGRRVRPWIYTIATNLAIDAQRKNKRHRLVSLDRQLGDESDSERAATLSDMVEDAEQAPVDRLLASEEQSAVREAVESLPDSYRQVLILVYFQGLKYREAADVLNIPQGTVKSRLHAAVQRVGEILGPFMDPAEDSPAHADRDG